MTLALFETHTAPGGAQRFLVDLARGLLARGWPLRVLLPGDGPLAALLDAAGVPVTILPLTGWPDRCRQLPRQRPGLAALWRVTACCRRLGVRRLLANSLSAAVLGGAAMRLLGGRTLWWAHLPDALQPHPLRAQAASRLVSRVVVTTPAAVRLLPVGAPVRVAAPAIDLERLAVRPLPARKRGETPLVGMLGCWAPREGQAALLRAFHLLRDAGRRGRLCLAGPACTAEEARFRAMAQASVTASRLADYVTFTDGDDPAGLLAACDVVVIPALQEATGRLALEAAALGRPVVASRIAALSEIVVDGHTGLLTTPNVPATLSDALELLLASPALRAEMGRQAREHADVHFSLAPALDLVEEELGGVRNATYNVQSAK